MGLVYWQKDLQIRREKSWIQFLRNNDFMNCSYSRFNTLK